MSDPAAPADHCDVGAPGPSAGPLPSRPGIPSGDRPPYSAGEGPDACPRCGGSFQCGMGGTAPCPCTTVSLPAELQAALRQRYTGCLCLACLQALAQGAEP